MGSTLDDNVSKDRFMRFHS